MTTEIELKYQLSENNKDSNAIAVDITAMLDANDISFKMNQNQLINDYFDNDNLALRKMDFGLRVRAKAGLYEQTIKTAGKVEAGLHQRPEYNIDIAEGRLDLSLFPANIWPENTNVMELQESLQILFSTNFSRHTWLIHQNDNIIELALDVGVISTASDKPSLSINEIEIELVSGNEQALFALAEQLKEVVSIQPSDISKAARGYALYYDKMEKS